MKEPIVLMLKGMAMGAANVIPGVSGGTVAFITGIYERLISALKSIGIDTAKLLLKGDFKAFAEKIDLHFLFWLFLGVFISILSLAEALELAFKHYEVFTLSFFFGLILASIVVVANQVEKVRAGIIVSFMAGAAIAAGIAFLPPAQPNANVVYVMLCGMVAVCSMILPGLSGSYILLLMGNYLLVLRAVGSFDFEIVIPLLFGCVLGLVIFSRFLSYLYANHKDATISLLAGFVAGSLLIIWPWKKTLVESFEGKEKAVGYVWGFPELSFSFFVALMFVAIGFLAVFMMERKANK